MTSIDEVEIPIGIVKQVLSDQLEKILASMKFKGEPGSPQEKKIRQVQLAGIAFTQDSLKNFVENICLVLDTAATNAIKEASS